MKKLKIAVIGAGSTYSPELIDGFLRRADSLHVESIYMMDIDERKNTIVSGLAQRMIKARGLDAKLVVTSNLEEAITGADYVMAQIRVGKLPARILDEKIPLKYDLLGQETTGTGGFFKALRTIPVMLNIARIMERVAPNAWLINFSNPSGIIAQMLSQETKISFAGLCNGPIVTLKHLKEATKATNFDFDFVGLNHFNWITKMQADGKDIFPCPQDKDSLKAYGINDSEWLHTIGGVTSGYLNYYYNRDSTVAYCKAQKQSRGEECMEIEEKLLELYQDENIKEKPALLDKRGGALYSEAAVSLVDAIENDLNTIHVVNVNHRGTIPFLDSDDIAEVKCRVGKDGPVPLPLLDSNINNHIVGMVRAVKAYEKLTVKAGLTGDYNTGLTALLTHPLVGDHARAKGVYDEMLEAHKEFLPQFAKGGCQ